MQDTYSLPFTLSASAECLVLKLRMKYLVLPYQEPNLVLPYQQPNGCKQTLLIGTAGAVDRVCNWLHE